MKLTGKVLVVDDEAHIRMFVSVLVKSMGDPVVLEAANGEIALEVYARERPRLVLLDVNMPRLDGLQTLRALKLADPGCVVVMLTSLVNRQTVEECLHLGAVAYLRKDNPPDQMTAQLSKIIDDCLGEMTSGEKAPGERPPAEKAPSEKPPAEKPPAEKPPAEKPAGENEPGAKPPGDVQP
jgi:CheY-like chemotaxis protein